MKQSADFILCDVADNHILMPVGGEAVNLNGMVTLNDMGVTIWNKLVAETDLDGLVAAILEEYEVTEEKARADAGRFLQVLRDAGCITD